MHRRHVLQVTAAAALAACRAPREPAAPAAAPPFELEEMSLSDLAAHLRARRWTSEAILALYLHRIDEVDRRGPELRAVLETHGDASRLARKLDEERATKGARGPLHGAPVLVKDNVDTGDGMATTAGSLALVGAPAARDAGLVTRLRAAGAVVFGKTNLSEWANFRASRSVSGWSARGGQTRNPYRLDRSPSGSSSGSAVAVAANLCLAAIGSETNGSIVAPASSNGIVGIKPTRGLVDGRGIVPISSSFDTPGPMARTVRDAALVLQAIAEPKGEGGEGARARAVDLSNLRLDALRGARIGVCRSMFPDHDGLNAVMARTLGSLKFLGAELVDPVDLPTGDALWKVAIEVCFFDMRADLEAYLATRPGVAVRTLRDVIAFNDAHAREEMAIFGQSLLLESERRGPRNDEYARAVERVRRGARDEGLDKVFSKYRVDAIVAPTEGPACLVDQVLGDYGIGLSSTFPAMAGYPHVTVPAGTVFDLPVGLSFIGPAWSDARMLGFAYAFEQAVKARRPPGFLAAGHG